MSGKRMVSSVHITLAPPRRAEIPHKTQTHKQVEEQRQSREGQEVPPPPPPPPTDHQSLAEQEDIQNGGFSSYPHAFLDDIPATEDFLGPDLPPPPPPPPSLLNSPKKITRDPSIAPVPDLPPPPPSLLKSPKQIPWEDLSVPDLPPPPPDLLPTSKQIPQDPSLAPVPDSLSLELMKLDLAHGTSAQLNSDIQPEPNVMKSVPGPYTQQRREEPVPARKPENGYPGKQENCDVCAFCHKAIAPNAAAIEAMKKQYHASCFTCRTCHRLLAGQLYYQKDGRPICEHCYKDTLEKCAKCQTLITQHIVRAMGNGYHPECFTCVVCHRRIADESFAVDEYNDVHCADDYYRKYAPICGACGEPIIPGERDDSYKIECLGKNFHENCYRCERCHICLSLEPTESGCYPLNGHLLCKPCHLTWKDGGS